MKLLFTQDELDYLNHKMAVIQLYSLKADFEDGTVRTVGKMKFKFRGKCTQVSLGAKERRFLLDMLNYRLQDLVKQNSISGEIDIVQSLIGKVEVSS